MSFWLDRFRDDEDEIWKELRYMLTHPSSKSEQNIKNKQELQHINSVLDKVFEDKNQTPNPQKEPYLKYEDLLNKEINHQEILSKLPKPVEKTLTKIQQDSKPIAKDDITKENLKKGIGVAMQVASLDPRIRGAKAVTAGAEILAKKMAPKVGRKIAKEISEGAVGGLASGGLEGLGRGLATDKNPLKTAAQDAGIGAVLGTTGGAIGGNVERAIRGKKLKNIDSIEKFNHNQIKNLRKEATNYYDDYIKGTTVKRKDMDDINFGNAGIGELRSKSLHNVSILPDLKKQIKTGVKKDSKYDYAREDISKFDIIQNSKNGKIYEYQIANDKINGNKFYMVKDTTKTNSSPTVWDQHPGSGKSSTNIIPPLVNNLNSNTSKPVLKLPSWEEWLEELKRKRRGF